MAQPLIDERHLEKYVGDDRELRDEILILFGDRADYLRDQFFVDQPDEAWRDAAHAMKGAAQAVGAWRLASLCDEAETCIGNDPAKSERRAGLVIAIRRQLADVAREALILLRQNT